MDLSVKEVLGVCKIGPPMYMGARSTQKYPRTLSAVKRGAMHAKKCKEKDLCAKRRSARAYMQINPKCVQKNATVSKNANAGMHGLSAMLNRVDVCKNARKGPKCNFQKTYGLRCKKLANGHKSQKRTCRGVPCNFGKVWTEETKPRSIKKP